MVPAIFLKERITSMKTYSDLEFLKLSKGQKLLHRIARFFASIPTGIKNMFVGLWGLIRKGGAALGREIKDIISTFIHGDWKTKLSFLMMGFGNLARGQILRGLLFLLFEAVFIGYMVLTGGYWLSMLPSLGKQGPVEAYDEIFDTYVTTYNDNSFKILLYGVLTIFFIVAFVYTWYANVKQNKIAEEILRTGKPLKSGKDDLKSLVDDQFHKTLLALPTVGILIFTVMPIIFMILVAFTNYSSINDGMFNGLFHWVGFENFKTMFSWDVGGVNYSATFGEILLWTLIWAFFATFTNYFLGMGVALMINKKGIRFKKMWRGILVLTSAVPQFVSLLYISKMFSTNGLANGLLMQVGIVKDLSTLIRFWDSTHLARVLVIVINIWIGIPYLMLITTGILMNIPADLYESARIDGANAWQQYTKITLPYMLFITGPYLLTSFTSNMNNFNVIYLLTGGGPFALDYYQAGKTDLLVTWLYKLTVDQHDYALASTIGIFIFMIVSTLSITVYNRTSAVKKEDMFQ